MIFVRSSNLRPAAATLSLALCVLGCQSQPRRDRKSTRLNSSHGYISYAVFCLKKKKKKIQSNLKSKSLKSIHGNRSHASLCLKKQIMMSRRIHTDSSSHCGCSYKSMQDSAVCI